MGEVKKDFEEFKENIDTTNEIVEQTKS